jgi:hypothetical protein
MSDPSSLFFLFLIGVSALLWLLRDRTIRKPKDLPLIKGTGMSTHTQETQQIDDIKHASLLVQAYLTEYQTLREEFLKRVEFASQVQIYSVLLLSASIPLFEYVDTVTKNGGDAYVLMLLAALIFCALGWYQIELDDKVAELDNYILENLAPKLKAVFRTLNTQDETLRDAILGWHLYWRINRYGSTSGIWLSLGVVGRTAVTVLGATFLMATYVYNEHFVLGIGWNVLRALLVGIVSFCVIWILISGYLVRNKYIRATKAVTNVKSNE